MMSPTAVTGSAERWGPLWGARPADWALSENQQVPTYEEALQIAYDEAYFVWLVNNEDIYGLSENLQWTPRVDAKLLVVEMSVVE